MKPLAGIVLALGVTGAPGWDGARAQAAEVISPGPETTALVVYPGRADGPYSGLALIVETRTVDLPAGPSTIRFRRVADTIAPQTAEIDGLPTPVSERDFDYDLLTPGSLLTHGVDQSVRLVRTNPKTGAATETPAVIRAAPVGVLVQTAAGVEALGCGGAPERIVFDAIPPGLSDKPTLSAHVITPSAGRYKLTVRYLASGFGWRADYVATIRPDGKSLDLLGWLTLQNRSADTLADAVTEVVAGRLALTGEDRPVETAPVRTAPDCWDLRTWAQRMANVRGFGVANDAYLMAPPPAPPPAPMMARAMLSEAIVTAEKRSNLGDYKLYTLNEPTTLAARQTKQIGFLRHEDVPFDIAYLYRVEASGEPPGPAATATRIELELRNKTERGLGEPLPAGGATVSAPDAQGRMLLAGQASVRDTPVGLPWRLTLGWSRLVQVTPRVVSARPDGAGRTASTVEAVLSNARGEPVTVKLRQAAASNLWKIVDEPSPHTIEAGEPQWIIRLAAGERRTFRYQISQEN
ncbi:MAG TPA: hypothetical protein VHY32_03705 [Caulobacteraceae bacterium]|nr:hypothetical protein [Caulobacteraceae bacterium]